MFFGKKPESYLGIDIGGVSLKLVELKNEKGRAKLVTYGYLEKEFAILRTGEKAIKDEMIRCLKLVVEKAHVSSKKVVAALPTFTVFSSVISLPQMSHKDLATAISWEAKKYVPMPLEEMVLDWRILGENQIFDGLKTVVPAPEAAIQEKPKKYVKVLLTAAPQKLVNHYVEIFKEAGFELLSLETEVFALERSLVGHDKTPIMLIDFGATTTIISVAAASVPLINRSIDLGGMTITKNLAGSLNINVSRAEQFKRDFGLLGGAGTSQIPHRIEFMLSTLLNEVRYVLNLWTSQSSAPIEKIILSGGSSWLPHLPQYLMQALGLKVIIGDPWARVVYPVELKPVLEQIGPRFAVAVGLAMREIY